MQLSAFFVRITYRGISLGCLTGWGEGQCTFAGGEAACEQRKEKTSDINAQDT